MQQRCKNKFIKKLAWYCVDSLSLTYQNRNTMTRPTDQIIEKAKQQVVTGFTTDVMPCSEIGRNWFIISVVNDRGGFATLVDYKFCTSTGKLISSKTIESKLI